MTWVGASSAKKIALVLLVAIAAVSAILLLYPAGCTSAVVIGVAPHAHLCDDILLFSSGFCTCDGMILEFGTASGTSIRRIAQIFRTAHVYGFDCWKGLPESWRFGFPKGSFTQSKLPEVPDNVTLVSGLFQDSLPDFLTTTEPNATCKFMHLDADLYSSTFFVLTALCQGKRIVAGTIIVFDEYCNYIGWEEHEAKAWTEIVDEFGIEFVWIARSDEKAACIVTKVAKS